LAAVVCVLPTLTRRGASRSLIRNRRFLGTPEIPKAVVLESVVVGVVPVATVLTLEVLAVAVVVVGTPTGRTPLRGVPWVHLHGLDALLSGFVFDGLGEATERPQMVPRRFWPVRTNVGRALEHDMRTIVSEGFGDDLVGDTM
jgi:hypothetical protein